MLAPMKLKALTLALLLSLAACKSAPNSGPTSSAVPTADHAAGADIHATGAFDFFLLNLSWSPEFCRSHPEAAECARRNTFVLHGLWPQNNDGSFPQLCDNVPGPDPAQFSDIYPDPGLLEHEWRTHGTCSGLSATGYFAAARTGWRSIAIPTQLAHLDFQISMPPDQLAGLFTQSNPHLPREAIAISCGHNYLTAVQICLDKSLHPIACPATVRSCRANSIRIAPPR
jgi:ribonuclease T2